MPISPKLILTPQPSSSLRVWHFPCKYNKQGVKVSLRCFQLLHPSNIISYHLYFYNKMLLLDGSGHPFSAHKHMMQPSLASSGLQIDQRSQ